jgi:hypothetical protein
MNNIGKILVFIGIGIVILGFIIWIGSKFLPFGKLPGDIHFKGEKFQVHFPIVTSIIVSLVLTIVLNLIFWIFRK